MALIFDRKEFQAGVQIVREVLEVPAEKSPDGVAKKLVKQHAFRPADKGKSFTFANEDRILDQYPHLFRRE